MYVRDLSRLPRRLAQPSSRDFTFGATGLAQFYAVRNSFLEMAKHT